MKNSTRKNSRNKVVQGLAFRAKGPDVYKSVYSWVNAGCPDNCKVYDHVDTLIAANIEICDAIYINGTYVRADLRVPAPRRIIIDTVLISKSKKVEVTNKVKGILVTSTKSTQKMAYQ